MKFLMFTALGLLATTTMATAEDAKELSRTANTIRENNAYTYEYDRDEQCQGYYWGVKRLGITNPCQKDEETVVVEVQDIKVLNEYVVYFDFDEATIRSEDEDVLRTVAKDIKIYNPRQVLVTGYTDTRGSMAYNKTLSAKRAENVSDYLNELGVSNFVVQEEAMGETNLAVPTRDEVKLQENRRVKIQFIH